MKIAVVAVLECLDHGMYNYMALYCWTFNFTPSTGQQLSPLYGGCYNEWNLTKNNQTTSKDSPEAVHKQNSNNFDDNDMIEKFWKIDIPSILFF